MSSELPLVLVLGATGHTGQSIVKGLQESGNFRIAALVRPSSASKAATQELRASGVEIRLGDLKADAHEKLKQLFVGVNIFISAVVATALQDQKAAFQAAKEAGVKRIIPCDFATPGKKGVRALHDEKLEIREYVKSLDLGYTFIDVGWWMQLQLPLPERSQSPTKPLTHIIYGAGKEKQLLTDLDHIGIYVARIIADPRTLNQSVIVWEDDPTQLETHELGERLSGEEESLKAKRVYITEEQLKEQIEQGRAASAQDPTNWLVGVQFTMSQYMYSIHILGENTLANAKRLGYLDARELYPDIPRHTLEDFAKEFYNREEPAVVYG
ncbi:NAD-P-binding protein [Trametes meyenii]|nr:NAD-P-binding protein [Trametes meyenii]